MQGRVNQMAYWIPLEAKPFVYAENGRIRNLSPSVVGAWLYWNTWAWKTAKRISVVGTSSRRYVSTTYEIAMNV